MKVLKENHPFGINLTKRFVSEGGEGQLFLSHKIEEQGRIELVDYMGGDSTVERVATAGHGRGIFKEKPTKEDLLNYLVANGIYEPFKSVQIKASILSPIEVALSFVYDPRVSLNEYSGRYSTMLSSFSLPSVDTIVKLLPGENGNDARKEMAVKIRDLILERRGKIREGYDKLLNIDMARELARGSVGIDNDTRYFWKIDLHSLFDFATKQRKLHRDNNTVLAYIEKIEQIAREVAPLSWDALVNGDSIGKEAKLTMPRDEEIVDGSLSPPQWKPENTRRVCVPTLEEFLFEGKNLLDHGEIQAVDYMGDDNSMAEAARTSYGEGTKTIQDNSALIKSLIRDLHTSPIEMAELAVEVKAPVFIDPRQWGRHRTLDNHGFMGITPIGSQFYFPPRSEFKYQDRVDRQGRGKEMDEEDYAKASKILRESFENELNLVQELKEKGVDEKIIRQVKGVGFYTKRWHTGDIHNWGHFLGLRLDSHAQKEIRVYAEEVESFIKSQAPVAAEALRTYLIDGIRLSAKEIDALRKNLERKLEPLAGQIKVILKKTEVLEETAINAVYNLMLCRSIGDFIDPNDLSNYTGQGWIVPVDREDPSKGRKLSREGEGFQAKLKKFLGK